MKLNIDIRRKVFKKLYKYIGKEYYDAFVITADDMIMNSIAYQYADNYSNILLPGYLYNIRNVSMSRGEGGIELKKIRTINHYQYFFILYKYIKDFDKDRNFLMYEMKDLNHYVRFIKDLDIKDNTPMTPNKKEEFKYTAFKLILKFLNEKMDL